MGDDNGQRRDFRTFFMGQACSTLGSSFTGFALPLVVYERTGSPLGLALSFALGRLPHLLFGLFAGAYADRVRRKPLLVYTNLLAALVVASVPTLAALDALPVWWLYVAVFLAGGLAVLFGAAEAAVVPNLVPERDYAAANGRLFAAYNIAALVGPPFAGAVAAVTPVVNVLWLDSLSFVLAALAVARIRAPLDTAPATHTGIQAEIAAGLRLVWEIAPLRAVTALLALLNLVGVVVVAEIVVFARERLGASPWQYGVLLAAGSLGVVACSLLAGPLCRRFAYGAVLLAATAFGGVCVVGLALAPTFWVAVPLWLLRCGLSALADVAIISLRQSLVPTGAIGRVTSFSRVVGQSTAPLGAVFGGLFVARFGVQPAYLIAGLLIVALGVGFRFSPLGRGEDGTTGANGTPRLAT